MYQLNSVLRWFFLASIAFVFAINVFDTTFFGSKKSASKPAPVAQPAQSLAGPSATTASPSVDAQDQLWEAKQLLSDAATATDETNGHVVAWNKVLREINDGPAAEAIASNEELVEGLASLKSEGRTSPTEIHQVQQRIGELQSAIDARVRQPDPKPIPLNEMKEIRELSQTSETALQDWNDAVARATAIQRVGSRLTNPASETDLAAKLSEQQDRETLDAFAEQRQWDAKQAAKQRIIDAERASAERDTKAKKLHEQEILMERATSTEVATVLAPFFHPRDVQPKMSSASLQLRKTLETKPMSLSALQTIGALDASLDGLKRLAMAGGDRKLSEPKWSVQSQPGNWTDGDKKMLQNAQRALIELGPTLVEAGLLSP